MNKEDDFMCDYDNAIFRLATAQGAEPEDYIGEDGLLYCGSCRQPKEAYFPEGKTFFVNGKNSLKVPRTSKVCC